MFYAGPDALSGTTPSSTLATLRFGLIGYGLWGRHVAAAIAAARATTLAAIACASETTAAAAVRDFPGVPVDVGYRALLARPEERVAAVAHGAPVAYVLLALEGKSPVRVLAGVEQARPFTIAAADLERALDLIDAWAASPAF